MRRTGFVFEEPYLWHNTLNYTGSTPSGFNPATKRFNQPSKHFENEETKRRAHNLLCACGVIDKMERIRARPATVEEVTRFHTEKHVQLVRETSQKGGLLADSETICSSGSYEIALLAAGGAIEAVDAVLSGKVDNAYVLCRPPGHHAEKEKGMGYCIFNNVVLAALHAKATRGISRIAIIDYDVHHGNGTESAFYDDDSVLFISLHQDRLYPLDTGDVESTGTGKGKGYNINIPLPPGTGIGGYLAAFDRVVVPAIKGFDPELILVSSGFDASAMDPLSHQMLTSSSFGQFALKMIEAGMAGSSKGKIVFLHEGGYSEVHVPFCCLRVVEALLGISESESNVIDDWEYDISQYGHQALQPHQDAAIAKVEANIAHLKK